MKNQSINQLLLDHHYTDPFATRSMTKEGVGSSQEGFVHIRIQQRNGRKTVTTVQGIADEFDKKKIVKVCKKVIDHVISRDVYLYTYRGLHIRCH